MEDGKVICYDTPRNVCEKLSNHPMSQGFLQQYEFGKSPVAKETVL